MFIRLITSLAVIVVFASKLFSRYVSVLFKCRRPVINLITVVTTVFQPTGAKYFEGPGRCCMRAYFSFHSCGILSRLNVTVMLFGESF